ncbi:MAG: CPBP family intramembrane glutamic endopeptidase [Ilumatobacteraceae bacterium]
MVALATWWSVAVHLALAAAIAGAVTYAGTRSGRDGVPAAFRRLFELVEERRTFVGLPPIVAVARTHRWALVIIVFAAAPTTAALVVAALGAPVDLGDLAGSLAPWRDVGAGPALATYTAIVAVHTIVCWWYVRLNRRAIAGGGAVPAVLRDRSTADVAARLGAGAVLDEGGTLEELGWRAFLLPLLLLELDRGAATLVLAVSWWAWHLPREVPALRRSGISRMWVKNQALFVGTCVALSVLCTDVVLRTGSVWPAVLVHGGTNVWSKALGAVPNTRWRTDVRMVLVIVLAVAVALSWGVS